MKVMGHIPEEIIIVSSGKECKWENGEYVEIEDAPIPGFPVDTNTKSSRLSTARSWAERRRRRFNRNGNAPEIEIKEEKVSNDPITLELVGLDKRSEGGRAYKVVDENGYVFDLREDVLLDTILNSGIEAGGKLGGQYVWAVLGNQTRFVRYNSDLHRGLVSAGELKSLKRIKVSELVPNTIYESKRGEKALFVGWISTAKYTITNHFGYTLENSTSRKNRKKAMLWIEFTQGRWVPENDHSFARRLDTFLRGQAPDRYNWLDYRYVRANVRTGHSYVREVERLQNFPDSESMILVIRNLYRDKLMSKLSEITEDSIANYRHTYGLMPLVQAAPGPAVRSAKRQLLCGYSEFINMAPHGQEIEVWNQLLSVL